MRRNKLRTRERKEKRKDKKKRWDFSWRKVSSLGTWKRFKRRGGFIRTSEHRRWYTAWGADHSGRLRDLKEPPTVATYLSRTPCTRLRDTSKSKMRQGSGTQKKFTLPSIFLDLLKDWQELVAGTSGKPVDSVENCRHAQGRIEPGNPYTPECHKVHTQGQPQWGQTGLLRES